MSDELSTGLENVREHLADPQNELDELLAKKRLAELCSKLALPSIPDLTQGDMDADTIREAIMDQVECVEARVPQMKGMTLKRIKNRGKVCLPLFYHTPVGKEWVRRLVFCGQFGQAEMALICGLKENQLADYIRGQGWNKQMLAIQREQDEAEWMRLTKNQIVDARLKITTAALKGASHLADQKAEAILLNLPQLRQLNEIMEQVAPRPKETEAADNANTHTVNVGLTILSHKKKAFDPLEAAKKAKASEIKPQEIEE